MKSQAWTIHLAVAAPAWCVYWLETARSRRRDASCAPEASLPPSPPPRIRIRPKRRTLNVQFIIRGRDCKGICRKGIIKAVFAARLTHVCARKRTLPAGSTPGPGPQAPRAPNSSPRGLYRQYLRRPAPFEAFDHGPRGTGAAESAARRVPTACLRACGTGGAPESARRCRPLRGAGPLPTFTGRRRTPPGGPF